MERSGQRGQRHDRRNALYRRYPVHRREHPARRHLEDPLDFIHIAGRRPRRGEHQSHIDCQRQ